MLRGYTLTMIRLPVCSDFNYLGTFCKNLLVDTIILYVQVCTLKTLDGSGRNYYSSKHFHSAIIRKIK